MSQSNITIVDYGVGNLQSLKKAFAFLGAEPLVTEDAEAIRCARALVLPGVGSFEAGMRGLKLRGLTDAVKEHAKKNKPLLGICLGAQLLLSRGHEFGVHEGLGVIEGEVVRFPSLADNEKVPQVGWNAFNCPEGVSWEGTIFDSFAKGEPDVYFVHSYILKPARREHIFGTTRYGGFEFCSAIRRGNVYGVQFHPEKSGKVGLHLLKNFVTLVVPSSHGD